MTNAKRFGSWLTVAGIVAIWMRGALAQTPETHEQFIQRSLHQLHCEQFDSGLATCATLRRWWPDHPAGYLNAANIYQTMMRDYRVRLFEAPFDTMIHRAVQLAEQQARKQATAEMLFALGSARGYQALHRFRRGEWMPALRDAVHCLNAMERSSARDPSFVDPNLALALYEYWKSTKLDFGLGIFARKREFVLRLLEKVREHGRYVSVDAAYSLQTIYLQKEDYGRAQEVNDWLYARFPNNPICLYHRALIFEKLDRPREALAMWEKLIARIRAFPKASDGFLAECHLRRAKIFEMLQDPVQLEIALKSAAKHARQRNHEAELEGSFESFDKIEKTIAQMMKKHSISY
jgi:tetratricopeptide (TPR) repeat protein